MKKINKNMYYMDTVNSRKQSLNFIKAVSVYKAIEGYKSEINKIIKEYL